MFRRPIAVSLMVLLLSVGFFLLTTGGETPELPENKGLKVSAPQKTIYPDEESMWRYKLKIEPSDDFGVTIKKLIIKAYLYDKRYLTEKTFNEQRVKEWWGTSYIKLGDSRSFGASLPSRNDIHFRDHIFKGVNDIGEEVVGTIRVHFSKEKKETETTEEEELAGTPKLPESTGMKASTDKEKVYPDEENAWRYRINVSAPADNGVNIKKLTLNITPTTRNMW